MADSPGDSRGFQGDSRGFSRGFQGILGDSKGIPRGFQGIPGDSRTFQGIPRDSRGFHICFRATRDHPIGYERLWDLSMLKGSKKLHNNLKWSPGQLINNSNSCE